MNGGSAEKQAPCSCFNRPNDTNKTKYRPVGVGGDEDILYDHVVRVEHAEIS